MTRWGLKALSIRWQYPSDTPCSSVSCLCSWSISSSLIGFVGICNDQFTLRLEVVCFSSLGYPFLTFSS
jgi:hypothetical protein